MAATWSLVDARMKNGDGDFYLTSDPNTVWEELPCRLCRRGHTIPLAQHPDTSRCWDILSPHSVLLEILSLIASQAV